VVLVLSGPDTNRGLCCDRTQSSSVLRQFRESLSVDVHSRVRAATSTVCVVKMTMVITLIVVIIIDH